MLRITLLLCTIGALLLAYNGHRVSKKQANAEPDPKQSLYDSLMARTESVFDSMVYADSIAHDDSLKYIEAREAETDSEPKLVFTTGDFNGDHIGDSAYQYKSRFIADSLLCIRFNRTIPSITIHGTYRGIATLQSPGDIDEDGKDELFVVPLTYGCEGPAWLYTLNAGHWIPVDTIQVYSCGDKQNFVTKQERNKYVIHYHGSSYWSEEKTKTMQTLASR